MELKNLGLFLILTAPWIVMESGKAEVDETPLLNGQAAVSKRGLLTEPPGTGIEKVRLKSREQFIRGVTGQTGSNGMSGDHGEWCSF